MFSSFARFVCALTALALLTTSHNTAIAVDTHSGKELFDREWKPDDSVSNRGDGLGPMFNARSCAACHHQQGSGGGGGTQHNVDLLTVVDYAGSKPPARTLLDRLHPGFRTANSVTLHAKGSSSGYESYRTALLGNGRTKIRSVSVSRTEIQGHDMIQWGNFLLQQSQRNTPSLFGAGLIDKISKEALAALDKENQERLSAAGIKPPSVPAAERRFGWKGQTPTLKAFVAGACANELGLQTKGNPQAADPTNQLERRVFVDMSSQQLDAMVDYVASLPPPKRWEPSSEQEATATARGALMFAKAKCQTCHIPDVEKVRGLYSDLQLHDMGLALSDPTGRALTSSTPRGLGPSPTRTEEFDDPERVDDPSLSSSSTAPYYGPTIIDLASVWRTPPLWGVRDSAPYLHDGRAATLDEAIKMHAGEAVSSAEIYRRMSADERRNLVTFVYSLGAP